MSDKIKPITVVLTEEQSELFDDIHKRLKALNDNGRLGLVIAQIHWKNGRACVVAGLIEDEEQAEKICLLAGSKQEDLDYAKRVVRF